MSVVCCAKFDAGWRLTIVLFITVNDLKQLFGGKSLLFQLTTDNKLLQQQVSHMAPTTAAKHRTLYNRGSSS